MQFTTPVKELKPRGYTFQKLYASDYITYRKEFGEYTSYTIWLWKKGRELEINSWYGYTENIVNFYRDNLEAYKEKNKTMTKPLDYMVLELHRDTGEVRLRNTDRYIDVKFGNDEDAKQEYSRWREVFLDFDLFDQVIKEVKYLTK